MGKDECGNSERNSQALRLKSDKQKCNLVGAGKCLYRKI
jgi:hypothetical protein